MNIQIVRVTQANGTWKYRIVIPIEDQIYYGIRKNPTPRNERNYPVRTSKRY